MTVRFYSVSSSSPRRARRRLSFFFHFAVMMLLCFFFFPFFFHLNSEGVSDLLLLPRVCFDKSRRHDEINQPYALKNTNNNKKKARIRVIVTNIGKIRIEDCKRTKAPDLSGYRCLSIPLFAIFFLCTSCFFFFPFRSGHGTRIMYLPLPRHSSCVLRHRDSVLALFSSTFSLCTGGTALFLCSLSVARLFRPLWPCVPLQQTQASMLLAFHFSFSFSTHGWAFCDGCCADCFVFVSSLLLSLFSSFCLFFFFLCVCAEPASLFFSIPLLFSLLFSRQLCVCVCVCFLSSLCASHFAWHRSLYMQICC
jgi:hypothetical protein